ncbi:MAG TPA: N-acetylmuramoyl-L-alanine amidase [Tenuifilaceae bacterium]|jgi:N-acetylmuramoyl-L-alanine amidase|nr:N-acetylmuramoyl-L-alanine amidase [Tenuifilaceae bacterium]HPM90142.1 N-acetylmuramoyl-L-alanine amidase [Tenuifilaceae bacterium]HPS04102.1 N-acetylmuramoyl-L-alanine amidase [Tenuifilaceae bacterium]HQM04559.1 N-acetylmuramoyl-L-alanine amidase [Tenuifilaceae bacterium]HQQ28857.1 N-acetylmuramoyl-L-alanine amidase [Tenuifilaceae bacterium]
MEGLRLKHFLPIPLLVVLSLLLAVGEKALSQTSSSYQLTRVVVDAGHGGKDPGTVGRVSKEKDIALSIALKVGSYIEKNFSEVKVIYTRKDDTFIPLDERSRIANEAKADLFISIHCNSAPNRTSFGTETYVMGLHRSADNLDVAMRENAVISYEDDYSTRYEGYDPSSSESYIIFSMLQNAFLDQSLSLANLIQTDFRDRASRKDRGVKQAGFLVLWKTSMPSVLVEVGYLSNASEEKYLNSQEGQDYIASSIYRAFKEYKKNVDSYSNQLAQIQLTKPADSSVEQKGNTQVQPPSSTSQSHDFPIFKVQLMASNKPIPLDSPNFQNIKTVEELIINDSYKYCVGSLSSYDEALKLCREVRKQFPDAFVIATKNGVPVALQQAIKDNKTKN